MSQTEWQQVQDLVKCIDDLEEGFERDFANSMKNKTESSSLTERQSIKLEELWNKHCGH